nr:metallophosphoesterase [Kofleriaceae bacterium]
MAGSLLLATCCPTLWIQLQRSSPTVWPAVPQPKIAAEPILPVHYSNRFDRLYGGAPYVAHDGYTDVRNPEVDARSEWLRAVDEMGGILADTRTPLDCTAEPVTLKCTEPGVCSLAVIAAGGPTPVALWFPSLAALRPVISIHISGHAPPTDSLDLGTPLTIAHVPTDPATGKPARTVTVAACVLDDLPVSTTLLSFVHLSDIQLRDPTVTLTDRAMSHRLDYFEPLSSFEYDEDMATYNQYVVQAIFATINKIVATSHDADTPAFVIHTGDSIDSGAKSELVRFHTLIDQLTIPFYDLFGNHDALVFGNLTPNTDPEHESDASCSPIAALLDESKNAFLPNKLCVDQRVLCPDCIGDEADMIARGSGGSDYADGPAATRARFIAVLRHGQDERVSEPGTGPGAAYCPGTTLVSSDPYSRDHGFDLNGDRGYYAFAQPLADGSRNAVFVALNSEDLEPASGGEYGRLGPDQATWLTGVLQCVKATHPTDLVFVLAHQPISLITVDQIDPASHKKTSTNLGPLLDRYENIVAYLFGHNHAHQICGDNRPGVCTHYWEVETDSLIEFPQEGRLVRIKRLAGNLAFLELTVFRERLDNPDGELGKYIDLARRGVERDFCHTKTWARCSDDQRVYRQDGRDANARLFFRMP